LFGKKNFEPGSSGFRIIFTDVPDLERHDFNNKTSSVVVVKGTWRLYPRKDYGGDRSRRLRPGLYPDVEDVRVGNNKVSSLRCRDDS
jgi:hypothetical protein